MMKRNRLTALLIAVIMLIGVMPIYAFAADESTQEQPKVETTEGGGATTEPTEPTEPVTPTEPEDNGETPKAEVSITVDPTTAEVKKGGTQQFTATVTNATDTSVTWGVTGNTDTKTKIVEGLLTVGADETATELKVTATSVENPTENATATVTVTDPAPVKEVTKVTISPTTANVEKGKTQQFTATVEGNNLEDENKKVTWKVEGGTATIDGTGLLTVKADETATTLTVTATSIENTTKNATATVTVTTPAPVKEVTKVTISPTTATVEKGTYTQFTATVEGNNLEASDKDVVWAVEGGKHTSTGVDTNGKLYVANGETAKTVKVIATSKFDSTKKVEAVVTVKDDTSPLTSVSISPSSATISRGYSKTFEATYKPTNLDGVTYKWTVSGANKDSTVVTGASTSEAKLYIASNETARYVTLKVTATYDGKSVSDTVTVYVDDYNYYDDLRITSAYRSGDYIKGRVSEGYATVRFYRDNSSSAYASTTADSRGDFSIYIGNLSLYRDDYLVASKSGYANSSKYYVSGWSEGGYSKEVYPTGLSLNRDNDRVEGRLSNYTNTKVYVYYDGSQIGSGYTNSNGYFDISLSRYVYRTSDLRFYVGSDYNEKTKEVYPTNKSLNSYGDRVEGRLSNYTNTKVYVYYDGSEIGSGTTDRYGDFDISLNRRVYSVNDLRFYVKTSDDDYKVTLNRIAYIKGFPDGSFRPNANMTRAEAATMFARLLNNGDNFGTSKETIFSDSNYKWHSQAVNYVVNKGYINGYGDGTFRPDENITRAEFAQMISKYLEVNVSKSAFSDTEKHWAKDAISILYGNKAVKGYPDGSFRPDTQITRAEAVTILNSVFGRVSDTSSFANLKGYLKSFNDISTNGWYYADVMDASNAHESYRTSSSNDKEIWTKIK